MARCDLEADSCLTDHICPRLDGRKSSTSGKQWYGRCPLHPAEGRKLSIVVGDRQRIVWLCHKGCPPSAVKTAMLQLGIAPGCIPWRPEVGPGNGLQPQPADTLAEIEKLLGDQPPPAEFMIRVAELLHGVDGRAAAKIAGISQATYYRHRRPK